MLTTMTHELHKQHKEIDAQSILLNLREMFITHVWYEIY